MNPRFIILTVLGFCLALVSCESFDATQINNLNKGQVECIGHAGSGFARWFPFSSKPDNSLGSIQLALESGADGVEVDVQMTNDGRFILYHDMSLESKTQLKGCIPNYSFENLQGIEYQLGWPFDWFQSEKLISLDKLIDLAKSRKEKPSIHLDLRSYSTCNTAEQIDSFETVFANHLHQQLSEYNYPNSKLVLISTSERFLLKMKELSPNYQLSIEVHQDFDAYLKWAAREGIEFLTVKPGFLKKEHSNKAHQAGIQIITFGVKSSSGHKRLLKMNPDIIQTDNVDVMKDLLP